MIISDVIRSSGADRQGGKWEKDILGRFIMELFEQLGGSPMFAWVILPLMVFVAKICDVTLGTLRIIFVARGKKAVAPLLGFFEVSIWLLAISQIMKNLNNTACFLAYAGGFAMGNFVGILIEDKLAIGTLIIRIFLVKDISGMKEKLYGAGFGVTSIDAHGRNGNVEIIYTIIKRRDLEKAVNIIEACQSKVFYSVEDAKSVKQGIFPTQQKLNFYPLQAMRKRHYRKQDK